MKITDLFRPSTSVGQSQVNRSESEKRSEQVREEQRGQNAASEDSVRISSLSRQLSQVGKVLAEDESARAKRVQELKKRVNDGTYDVSSEEVAKSIDSYLRDA